MTGSLRDLRRVLILALLLTGAAACGEPTGPEALEESSFEATLQGAISRSLAGHASLTETTALFPEDPSQEVWLLSLTGHRPGERTEIQLVGGTETPEKRAYRVAPFDPPLSADRAIGLVAVFTGDSVTSSYLARSGEVTMTRVTSREAYGTVHFEATSGDSLMVTVQAEFRGYH